jgi:hypothetical protein
MFLKYYTHEGLSYTLRGIPNHLSYTVSLKNLILYSYATMQIFGIICHLANCHPTGH